MPVKIDRVYSKSTTGNYPSTASALLAFVPASVVAKCSSTELAELLDSLYDLAQNSKALASREALENGFVWDSRRNIARDLAPLATTIRSVA